MEQIVFELYETALRFFFSVKFLDLTGCLACRPPAFAAVFSSWDLFARSAHKLHIGAASSELLIYSIYRPIPDRYIYIYIRRWILILILSLIFYVEDRLSLVFQKEVSSGGFYVDTSRNF